MIKSQAYCLFESVYSRQTKEFSCKAQSLQAYSNLSLPFIIITISIIQLWHQQSFYSYFFLQKDEFSIRRYLTY